MDWKNSIKEVVLATNPKIFEYVDDGYFKIVYSNQTEVNIFLAEDKNRLVDIIYWNELGKASLDDFGVYFKEGECSVKNVRLLQSILDIPINRGWTELTTSVKGKPVKEEVYYGVGDDMEEFPSHSSMKSHYGCLSLFTSPLKLLYLSLPNSVNKTEIKKNEILPVQ